MSNYHLLIGSFCGLLLWFAIVIVILHVVLWAKGWTLEELVRRIKEWVNVL